METGEEVLIRRAQKGNQEAFEGLVRGTSRLVYAHIVMLVRDPQRAEDLTQETYLAAWKALAKLDRPEGFRSWLLTIGRNLCINEARAAARRKRAGLGAAAPDEVIDQTVGPAAAAELSEQQEQLLGILESLPENYRQPLMLRYLAGADHDTIRAQLGLSDGALRGHLHRGMALLRERMTTETRRHADPKDHEAV